MVVSLAVLYNVIFVLGRAVFWELNNATRVWLIIDYLCDFIYILDTLVHAHEGKLIYFSPKQLVDKCWNHDLLLGVFSR